MKRLFLGLIGLGFSSSVCAGPFNDKLAICLVKSTTEADKIVLMRWIFAAMASHPSVKELGSVPKAQGDKANKDVAALFMTLVSERCGAETKEAVKYEGASAIGSSFEVLGRVAMQSLMADAEVTKYMAGVDANLDPKTMNALLETPAAKP